MPSDQLRSNIFPGAPAAAAASATRRPRARTSSARSSSPRMRTIPHDRRRVLPGVARRRPRGPLGARAQLRRARTRCVRGALRQGARRPADEQPRRAQLPARQPREGDRAAEGSVRRSRSRPGATPMRRRRSPRSRRFTSARADVEQAEEQARHALQLLETAGNEDYIDEVGSAQLVLGRALLEQDRIDEAEDGVPRRRGLLRPARLRRPSRRRVGRPWRPRGTARRRQACSTPLPHRG